MKPRRRQGAALQRALKASHALMESKCALKARQAADPAQRELPELPEAVLSDCLAIINPPEVREAECVEAIRRVFNKTSVLADLIPFLNRGIVVNRDIYLEVARRLRPLVALIKSPEVASLVVASQCSGPLPADDEIGVARSYFEREKRRLGETLDHLESILQCSDNISASRGGKFGRMEKTVAASGALYLLRHFSSCAPTLSVGGAYMQLAAVLYGAAAGEKEANLDWHCRRVFHRDPLGH